MAHDTVLWLGENPYQCPAIQGVEADKDRQTPNKFGDQPKGEQIIGHHLMQQFTLSAALFFHAPDLLFALALGQIFGQRRDTLFIAFAQQLLVQQLLIIGNKAQARTALKTFAHDFR